MFLRCTNRKKDGKEHRYWNIVENRRVAGGRVVQRQVLYLGEINGSQREAWRKTIEVFEDGSASARTMALFPEDRPVEVDDEQVVQIRLKEVELRRPRQWGACWLACRLYEQLGLDAFWAERLPPSRKGTRWDLIAQALCCYRLIDPGSEWRLSPGTGMRQAPWPTFWGQALNWWRFISSTSAWTGCSNINKHCLTT